MTREQLITVHQAKPFRPFVLHLADGDSIPVKHPELLWRTTGGRTIFINTGGENVSIVDLLLVTRITMADGSKPRGHYSSSR